MLKKIKSKKGIITIVSFALLLLCVCGVVHYYNYANIYASPTIVLETDPMTIDGYKDIFDNNTDSAGRIWTDKSVSKAQSITVNNQTINKNPNADFQVALSAISSFGKLSEKSTIPYDITLVLDVSGSMRHPLSTTNYTPTYNPSDFAVASGSGGNKLFALVDGQYIQVKRQKKADVYYYTDSNGKKVEIVPKTSPDQVDGVQTYCYYSRIDDLRKASGEFVKLVEEENKKIDNPNLKHRVSVVSFSKDSIIDNTFVVPVSDGSANDIQKFVRNIPLRIMGQTATHLAMQSAFEVNQSARPNANKVVILFTDGKPAFKQNMQNSFVDPAILAVDEAKKLKATPNTEIYSIGMFDEATAQDPLVDGFMNAVSSMYMDSRLIPNQDHSSFTIEGTPVFKGEKYAKTVKDGTSLVEIFKNIFGEINANSGYATEIEIGKPDTSGYITITDPLGKYMNLESFDGLVFNQTVYTNPTKTVNGSVETYIFEGEVSTQITPKTNLNKIIINLDKTNPNEQVINIKLPASVIPVYLYEVVTTSSGSDCKVTPEIPIRLVYSVGLNEDIRKQLLSGNISADLQTYIDANKDSNSNINFYTNAFTSSSSTGATVIDSSTNAKFIPSSLNNFYKFDAQTPVYTDEDCQNQLTTEPVDGVTYYYQKEYYDMSASKLKLVTKVISYVETPDFLKHYVNIEGKYFIQKGVYRNQQVLNAGRDKTTNLTGTANYSIAAGWNVENGVDKLVEVKLGNNGLMKFEIPSSLEISKTVVNTEMPQNVNNDSFSFKIELKKNGIPLTNSFYAKILDGSGNVVKPQVNQDYMVESGDTFVLKHNQKMIISGLPADIDYSVSEINIPVYYKTTVAKGTQTAVNGNKIDGNIPLNTKETVAFTNTYAVASVDVEIPFSKSLTGRKMNTADKFTFNIKSKPSNTKVLNENVVVNGENGVNVVSSKFSSITFDTAGTYEYTVTEVAGTDGSIKYSDAEYNVKIVVVDNGTGQLTATKTIELVETNGNQPKSDISFVNKFTPNSTSVQFKGKKVLTGNRTLAGNDFTFKLYDNNGAELKQVTNLVNGQIKFPAITYNQTGTYNYKIKEVKGTDEAITYDESVIDVKVVISYNDTTGEFSSVVSYSEGGTAITGDFEFDNSYKAKSVTVEMPIAKTLNGRKMNTADKFTFNIKSKPSNTKVLDENVVVNGQDGVNVVNSSFTAITFDVAGTYEYIVTEVAGTDSTIKYSDAEYDVKIVVVDNGTGQLTATKTIVKSKNDNGNIVDSNTTAIEFTNEFTPKNARITLNGTKILNSLTGNRVLTDKEFSFILTDSNSNQIATVKNNQMGKIIFPEMSYSSAGTHIYYIKEDCSANAPGITYDTSVVKATVTVSYNDTTGVLSASVEYAKGIETPKSSFTFENTYEALPTSSVSEFKATKKVIASQGNSYNFKGNEFDFKLVPDSNNPAQDPVTAITKSNDINGVVKFGESGEYVYTQPGTYKYTLNEIPGSVAGISKYDNSLYIITVSVTDKNSNAYTGKLVSTVQIQKASSNVDEIVFNNEYNPSVATYTITGKKNLNVVNSNKTLEASQFSFVLVDKNDNVIETVQNDANGDFTFSSLTYDRPGNHKYFVKEINDAKNGFTYDQTVYTVNVSVVDDNAQLKATSTIDNASEIVFNNSYEPKSTTVSLNALKKLDGRKLKKEEFKFELVSAQDMNLVIDSKSNDIDGNILFDPINYIKEGEYKYIIREKNDAKGGITYDQAMYGVTVTVTDVYGNLEATVKYFDANSQTDKVQFNNIYKAAQTSVKLTAIKTLDGRKLKADEFEFVLLDKDGNALQTVRNDGSGNIVFDELVYDIAGEYVYYVAEKVGKDEKITYDDSKYMVVISVADDGNGMLVPKITITKDNKNVDKIAFVNTFDNGYDVINPFSPNTGEYPYVLGFGMVTVIGLLIAIVNHRKNYKNI